MNGATILMIIIAGLVAIPIAVVLLLYVIVPVFKGIGWFIRQVFMFIFGEIGDALRILGALITSIVLTPLVIGSIIVGRWSASSHYGRAIQGEFATLGKCVYRMAIGHPARLLCLTALTDGIERRLPEVVAAAPGADRPSKARQGQFDGYTIVGSLPGGGSGGKLYVARPDAMKQAIFARNGQPDVREVVIKTFSLRDGSSLPQIVRESRALDAAKKLGLVLEHELTDERFFYITRYVPGESLGLVTQRLHAGSGGEGLGREQLTLALGYVAGLLRTLEAYHRGGLWHKDVKPDNIIIEGTTAHLVDFGLVTPLRSAMTLTTHGTEYFRDPEMVRLALRGVKVHEVDGGKFDIYAVGAVLFSVIENSFPAHGGLSQISRRCPETIRWIVRRAMTDYDKRYVSASQMLLDVDAVLAAADPFALKPVDLPSMRGVNAADVVAPPPAEDPFVMPRAAAVPAVVAGVGAPAAAAAAAAVGAVPPRAGAVRQRPRIRVAHWWSGRYESDGVDEAPAPARGPAPEVVAARHTPVPPRPEVRPRGSRLSAREQIEHARTRAAAARQRAQDRLSGRRSSKPSFSTNPNPGVAIALFGFLAACVGLVAVVMFLAGAFRTSRVVMLDEPSGARIELAEGLINVPLSSQVEGVTEAASHVQAEVDRALRQAHDEAAVHVEGARVLVLNDVQAPVAKSTSDAIAAALQRLREAGFELLGNIEGNPAEGEELTHQLDLAAAIRAEVGLRPLGSEDSKRAAAAWLSANESCDLLLWIGRSETKPEDPKFWLFRPTSTADGDPRIAEVKGWFDGAYRVITGR